MAEREEMAVELLTSRGWYRGFITLPAGGRMLDYLNTKPAHIALASADDPDGRHHKLLALNGDEVVAIREALD